MTTTSKRTPAEFAFLAQNSLVNHLSRLDFATQKIGNKPSRAEHLARIIAVYAETGEGPHITEIIDYITEISSLVFGDAACRPLGTIPLGDHGLDPLGEMIDAARGRLAITEKVPVNQHYVAALAGVSVETVRAGISKGKLKATARGLIDPHSAKNWLAKRDIMGFPRPALRQNNEVTGG